MEIARKKESIAGLSLKAFLVTMIGILFFGIYVGVLIYGENSLTILNQLREKKQSLFNEKERLKSDNQRLQKEYFELKQLEPKE